jgi:acetyl-CoA carboxylase biotin carboxyl carrier protein
MALTDEDVREILRIIDESELDELRIETPEFKLHVRRGGAPPAEEPDASAPPAEATASAPAEDAAASGDAASTAEPGTAEGRAAAGGDASSDGAVTIDAPMLGTFYRAEAPGAKPFVDVGAEVRQDTVVCLIEVMKMMNSIRAGVDGRIVEVCAENAQLVEFGQPLFRVEPSG